MFRGSPCWACIAFRVARVRPQSRASALAQRIQVASRRRNMEPMWTRLDCRRIAESTLPKDLENTSAQRPNSTIRAGRTDRAQPKGTMNQETMSGEAGRGLGVAPCSALRVEAWECRRCGKTAPCRVEITYEPTPYPHVEKQDRFRNRECLAAEPGLIPEWKRMPNK